MQIYDHFQLKSDKNAKHYYENNFYQKFVKFDKDNKKKHLFFKTYDLFTEADELSIFPTILDPFTEPF